MRNAPNNLGRSIGRRLAIVAAGLALLILFIMLGLIPVSFAP